MGNRIGQAGNIATPRVQAGNKLKCISFQDIPDATDSMAANRGRRNVQRKLYTESDNDDDDKEEIGETVQAGRFVYIV